MPASIRRVGDDVSVSVSPERLVKKAERTEAEMASIHRALRELEEAVAEAARGDEACAALLHAALAPAVRGVKPRLEALVEEFLGMLM